MIKKSIIILVLSCTVGAGYVLAGTEIGDSFPLFNTEVHQGAKKISAVKPKSFYSKRKTSNEDPGFTSDQYSFFPVLNDPSLSKMVGLNGKIIEKYGSSPPPVRKARFEEKTQRKTSAPVAPARIAKASRKIALPPIQPTRLHKVVAEPKKIDTPRLKISAPQISPSRRSQVKLETRKIEVKKIAVNRKPAELFKKVESLSFPEIVSFVVQVSAFRQGDQAEALRNALGRKGYAAFIGKTELPGNGGAWHRVYIGRYFNQAGAERAAERFFREENRKAVVVRQSG